MLMIKFLLGIFFTGFVYVQAPTAPVDKKIVPSDFFVDEYPGENVCSVKVAFAEDVVAGFTDGQCIKYRASDEMFFGGQCGTGGGGFNFDADLADTHQSLIFPVQQRPHNALLDFTTAACPTGWGTTCWSTEPNAAVGSVTGTAPDDIVLLSNSRVAYGSTTDKRVKNVWVGNVKYAVNFIRLTGTLGTRQVVYSSLSPSIPGTNWEDVKFEFTDGSFSPSATGGPVQRTLDKAALLAYLNFQEFSPTQANMYPATQAILKAGQNVTITPSNSANTLTISASGQGGTVSGPSAFIALDNEPTNLASYAHSQPNTCLLYTSPSPRD